MPMQSDVHRVRGLELAFHTWGERDLPVLMFLHGFMDCGRSFAPIAQRLSGQFRVVAPDMRGFGQSGWVGAGGYYHFYDYFSDVAALVRHLGVARFALVGHSMGGSIATGIGALLPGRCLSMVLLEGLGPAADSATDTAHRLRAWLTDVEAEALRGGPRERAERRKVMAGLDEAGARLRRHNPRLPEQHVSGLLAALTEPAGATHPPGSVVWRHDPLHLTRAAKPFIVERARSIWAQLDLPVLALSGALSEFRVDDMSRRLEAFPSVLLGTVPGAGHNMHYEQPQLLADVIGHWCGGQHDRLPKGLLSA